MRVDNTCVGALAFGVGVEGLGFAGVGGYLRFDGAVVDEFLVVAIIRPFDCGIVLSASNIYPYLYPKPPSAPFALSSGRNSQVIFKLSLPSNENCFPIF